MLTYSYYLIKSTCLTRIDVEVEDIDTPIASHHVPCVRCMPARFVTNHVRTPDEGGEENILLSILCSDNEELELECQTGDFSRLIQSFIHTKVTFAGAALTDPIDDPNAKDPQPLHKAKSLIYWTYWLAAIHEELQSLKAKGVYNKVKQLPPG